MHDMTLTEQPISDRAIWRNISILIGAVAILMGALAVGVVIVAG
jgi:hypothetical protein